MSDSSRLSGSPLAAAQSTTLEQREFGLAEAIARLEAAEGALAQREAELRTLRLRLADHERALRVTRHPVMRTDASRRILWVNTAFEQLTGYTLDEIRGRSPSFLSAPGADAEARARMDAAIARAEPVRATLLNQAKDGRRFWIDLDVQPLFDPSGRLEGFHSIGANVTALVEARLREAEALASSRAQEALLNSMAEAANVGAWEIDLATMTPIWSQQIRRIHEVDDDYQPTLETAIGFYAPAVRATLQSVIERSLETGERWDLELPLRTARGRWIWVRAIGAPVQRDGRTVKLVGALSDITAQRLENDRRRFEAQLSDVRAEVQSAFVRGDAKGAFAKALDGLIRLTDSEYGFIGERLLDPDGAPYLLMHAITNLAWTEEARRVFEARGPQGMEFRQLNTLFGHGLRTQAPVFSSDPSSDPRSGSAPAGHPPLHAFLGAPVHVGGDMVAMVGLANRRQGYDEALLASIQPLLDALGQLIVAERERVERRRLEGALQDGLATADRALRDLSAYQAALDQHAIVAITDRRGDILFVNDRFCAISGYAREELLGRNHRILNSGVHPREFFHDMWRAIARGQSWHAEVCNRRKNGELYWVDTTIVPMVAEDGRPERFVSVRYDITARKQADRKLQDALDELRGFFDVSIDLLCVASLDGCFLRVNRAFEASLGWRVEELEGRNYLELVHPDDVAETLAAMRRLVEGGPVLNFVNRYRCADGGYRHLEWRSVPSNGVVYAAARDIGDRLAHEAEITAARDRAETATQAKSTFLANMSHEIRTPLNGVVGLAGALASTKLDARQAEMVSLIRTSGETLERLLSDILDMSKIEAGKLHLECEAFDLRDAIETAAQVMRVRADDKGLAFAIRYGPSARGLFQGDVVRIRQIVSNLTSNAIKFTAQGGVTIAVDVEDHAGGSEVRIAVTDTGVGFDSAAADRLFGRFEQADGSTTRTYGGTGLGLAICRSLCELMGGRIAAASEPGRGSSFEVRLPLDRTMPLADFDRRGGGGSEGEAQRSGLFLSGNVRVLLAEDHPVNQRVITLMLQPFGATVTIAANGEEAVASFAAQTFDVILMDMQMPVLDGLAATLRIRAEERRRGGGRTPIVMLSANALPEHVDSAMTAGCDLHLAKPITPDRLVEALELALSMGVSAGAADVSSTVLSTTEPGLAEIDARSN